MILLRGEAAKRTAVRSDRTDAAVLRQIKIAAGDNAAGFLIAENHPFRRHQGAVDFPAFDPRFTEAHQAAETGQLISFPMQADHRVPGGQPVFAAEGADDGAAVTAGGDDGDAAIEGDIRVAADRSDSGRALAGGSQMQIAGGGNLCPAGDTSDQENFISLAAGGQVYLADSNYRVAKGRTDADHVDTVGGHLTGTMDQTDSFPGTAAAADTDHPVPGGGEGDLSGEIQDNTAVGIIIAGADTGRIVAVIVTIQLRR